MDKLLQTLKDHQCRVTQARKEIYQLLEKSKLSMNAKEVFAQLPSASSTDLVSVYRNLTLFNDIGLLHKFQDGSFAVCKHNEEEDEKHHHVHFIVHCVKCGRKSEIAEHDSSICKLAQEIKKVSKPLKTFHEIIVQGLCTSCA